MSTSVEQVRQWNHGAPRRLVWLLAALSTPALVAPDSVDIAFEANAPEITVAASPNIEIQQRVTFIENVRVVRTQNRAAWLSAVITASAEEPEIATRTRHSFVERVRLISGQKVNAERFLIASGVQDPSAIYPPTLSINFTPLAPTIQSFELIPAALHDDGHWEPPGVFIRPRSGVPIALDVLELHVSPQALAITFTTVAPEITASANALIYPSAARINFTPYAPTILIDGAPILTPAPLAITFTPRNPTITAIAAPDLPDKVGGDDAYHHRATERVVVHEKTNPNLTRAKLRLNREKQLDEELREIYRRLTAEPATAEAAEKIVAPVVAPAEPVEDRTAAPYSVAPLQSIEQQAGTLRAKADAGEPAAVEAEIALRLLYRQWREAQEADDQAAIELLLKHLL